MRLCLSEAEQIVEYIQYEMGEDAEVYEDYSGRGMYGNTCAGIVVDNPGFVWYACGALGMEAPKNQDSLGRQTILY
jgi:hypothetical protein